jgi:adenine-specific DNA-methyltransferase
LDFKGKQFVYSHHLGVPFRELIVDEKKSLPISGGAPSLDDNLIIHGDNLEALKALLPTHAGKVDCVFIDPPYNTGNEGWCYNDNVRSPLMKEWLKKSANPVDKDDLERHDKWLCMMWPRLSLLRELLAESGSVWMTLDDNEAQRAKLIMDEIFGEDNFMACLAWEKVYSPRMDADGFSKDYDSVLVYAKAKDSVYLAKKLAHQRESQFTYIEPDTGRKARLRTLRKEGSNSLRVDRPKTFYKISAPDNSEIWPIKPDGTEGTWRWESAKVEAELKKNQNSLHFEKKPGGDWEVFVKQYYRGDAERPISTILHSKEYGHTHEASEELKRIFGKKVFDTPKPTALVRGILELVTHNDSLILDSFAGSGTTAHSVLDLNNRDGGRRRFILVESEEYADTLTAERVRRVIGGYSYKGIQSELLLTQPLTWSKLSSNFEMILDEVKSVETFEGANFEQVRKQVKDGVLTVTGENRVKERVKPLGGSFAYCRLGEPMQVSNLLSGEGLPNYESLAKYVYYTATGQSISSSVKQDKDGFIGETDLFTVHLFYKPEQEWLRSNEAALNGTRVEAIGQRSNHGKRAIVFAVAKFMSQRELTSKRIEFCQLPYAIHRVLGD